MPATRRQPLRLFRGLKAKAKVAIATVALRSRHDRLDSNSETARHQVTPDERFDMVYPDPIHRLQPPIDGAVARRAELPDQAGTKVLDVGSGSGSCIIGALTGRVHRHRAEDYPWNSLGVCSTLPDRTGPFHPPEYDGPRLVGVRQLYLYNPSSRTCTMRPRKSTTTWPNLDLL